MFFLLHVLVVFFVFRLLVSKHFVITLQLLVVLPLPRVKHLFISQRPPVLGEFIR